MSVLKKIILLLKKAFQTPPQLEPTETGIEKRSVDYRNLVAKYSNGNISLQLGRYITESDIETRRKDIGNYEFSDKDNEFTDK
jgi:hypothetical protein